jgi:hypothetical protein
MQQPKSASGFSSPTQCRASSKTAALVDLLLRKALMQVSRSHRSLTGRCLVGRRRQVTADDPERNGNCCRGSTGGKMVTNRPSMPILGIGGRCNARQQNLFLMKTWCRVRKLSAATMSVMGIAGTNFWREVEVPDAEMRQWFSQQEEGMFTKATLGLAVILATASGALAATKTYNVDPSHPAYTNVYNPSGAYVGTDPDINVRLWERENWLDRSL